MVPGGQCHLRRRHSTPASCAVVLLPVPDRYVGVARLIALKGLGTQIVTGLSHSSFGCLTAAPRSAVQRF